MGGLTPQKMCLAKIQISTGPLHLKDQKFSLGQKNSSTAFRDYEGQTFCSDFWWFLDVIQNLNFFSIFLSLPT